MSKWTNNPLYEIIIDGEERELGPTITEKNIERYKQQDLQRISREGGQLATNQEYEEAEIELQQLYKSIMGVQ